MNIENKDEMRVQSFRFDAAISNGRLRTIRSRKRKKASVAFFHDRNWRLLVETMGRGSAAAVCGAFSEVSDGNAVEVFSRVFGVGMAEIVMVDHRGDGRTAWDVSIAEYPEAEPDMVDRRMFAVIPLAYDGRRFFHQGSRICSNLATANIRFG